jgi:hypothetical protein
MSVRNEAKEQVKEKRQVNKEEKMVEGKKETEEKA